MNAEIIYPSLLIIAGIIASTAVIVFLTAVFKKFAKSFQLYPESKGILNMSLKFISWFAGFVVFLVFLRLALRVWNLEFTTKLVEDIIKISPKYIVATLIILCGFYVSRVIRERSKDYDFEFKNRVLLVIDFIVHMTFIFTALYSIGINMVFFIEFYKVILWIIGAILALVVSMTIGIPLGISVYDKMKKEKKLRKR